MLTTSDKLNLARCAVERAHRATSGNRLVREMATHSAWTVSAGGEPTQFHGQQWPLQS